MKKTTLLLFVLVAITYQSFGQISSQNTNDKQQLLKVKAILEEHFSGTNIRSLQKGFDIQPNGTIGYSFISEVNGLFPEKSNKLLSTKLNKALKLKNNTKLTGTIYFDDCLDSTLVNIEYKREDTVYSFISMSGYTVPRGGFKAFSKRLHDFIKEQIDLGKLTKDSVVKIQSVNLLVDKSGSFKQHHQNYLSKAIATFLASEPRWNPGIQSGKHLSTVVSFLIIPSYINSGGFWPTESNYLKKYYNYNDFEDYVNIYTIAYFDNENIPVFYNHELLQYSGKTTVSAVYDNVLEEYRMFVVHNGDLNTTKRLITSVKKEAAKKMGYSEFQYRRVYFMID